MIGATASVFSRSSVQFLVTPTGWTLFYTVARTTQPGTAVVTLARGSWSAPLAVDAAPLHLGDEVGHDHKPGLDGSCRTQ